MRYDRYDAIAILLHWLVAVGVAAQIAIGLAMTQLPLTPAHQFPLYQLHKSIGITVLAVVLLRVAWRLTHRPPPLPDTMPLVERRFASAAHWVLYGLLLGLPLTGWAVVSASPYNIPTVLYGLVPWPHLPVLSTLHDKAPVEAVLATIHALGGWFLAALIGLHATAALRHHLLLHDAVLWRMLPLLRRPGPRPNPPGPPRTASP
jgi:cytochrome b561